MSQNQSAFRVGYVVRTFPSLYETTLLNELLAMEARGIPLHVFSLQRPKDPRFHDDLPQLKASITYVPESPGWGTLLRHSWKQSRKHRWKHFWTTTRALFTGNPELLWRCLQAGYIAHTAEELELNHLHAHEAGRASTTVLLASRMTGIPHSFSAISHDIFKKRVSKKALRKKLRDARFVTTISEHNRKHLTELSPESADKVFTVYPGIRMDRFTPGTPPAPAPFRFICATNLAERKGIPVLVKAGRRLLDRGVEFQLDILGSGGQWNHLRNVIRGTDLQSHIHLHGPQRHHAVPACLNRGHAFILPSIVDKDGNRDGMPSALLEALACGLPVIASNLTGIPEVVKQNENGLLVKSGDPDALADAMESLVKDPELCQRLQSKARDSVAGRFGHERTAASMHHILEKMAAVVPAPTGLRALGLSLRKGFQRQTDTITGAFRALPTRFRKTRAS